MKRLLLTLTALLAGASLLLTGCNGGGSSIDTSGVESAFAGSDATLKGSVDRLVSAVKARDWTAASAEIQKLAANAKLTPEQKLAVNNLWEQVKTKVSAAMTDAQTAADKAMKDAGTAADKAVKDLGGALKK